MPRHLMQVILWTVTLLLAACGAPAALPPTPALVPTAIPPTLVPAIDPAFVSSGGGEPRSTGYWLMWNGCAPDNQAALAAANGGRAAGWVIMDDLLDDPGVSVGQYDIETCEQGLRVLNRMAIGGEPKEDDSAYDLAAQLLAAQLNLAIGAEVCPAVQDVVLSGQLLLLSAEFDGMGDYLGSADEPEDRKLARFLVEQLGKYNAGVLCR